MKHARVLALALGLAATPALGAFVFRIGDTVYADGKEYSWAEWRSMREKDAGPGADAQTASAARSASCVAAVYHAEFPSDDERFDCSAGLGARTREELARAGWRIDYVDRTPAPEAGVPPAARSVPLYKYTLIISREALQPAAPPALRAREPRKAGPADRLCLDDCLGSGGTREFCTERCRY